MKILITGNMGYVGPLVVDQLRRSHPDATLLGFDVGYFAPCLTTSRVLPESRLNSQHFGDVRTFPAELLTGVDSVVYLAAISNDPMGNAYENVTLDINYRACVDLAKKAKAAGVGFIRLCIELQRLWVLPQTAPRNEQSALDPLTAYARSKGFRRARRWSPLQTRNSQSHAFASPQLAE